MVRRLVFCLDCEGVFFTEMRELRSKKVCPDCSSEGTLRKLTQFDTKKQIGLIEKFFSD